MANAKELLQRMHDVWNAHDIKAWRELATSDAQITLPGVAVSGPDGMEEIYMTWHDAFPDNSVIIRTIIGEGDAAAAECTFTGTNTGVLRAPSGNVPATGRRVSLGYTIVIRAAGDRVASQHVLFDQVELMNQLGLTPAPAHA
jgi:predicted ester cyclase